MHMRLTTGLVPVMKLVAVSLMVGVGLGLYLGTHFLPL
ncbi:MAG: hypothetical protein V7637_935 [Mycobacteriales bacterium]|jgi:hypothetical protein